MGKPQLRLFLYFLFTLVKYFQLKIGRTAVALFYYKRWTVRKLLWRRGMLFRPAAHFSVAVLAVLALVGSAILGPLPSLASPKDSTATEVVAPPTLVQTNVPDNRPRAEVITHTVSAGETLSAIANQYAISVDTIKWANNLTSDNVNPGQQLTILPVTGVLHKVASGETIDSVAKKHSASSQAILDFPFNDIPDDLSLKVGQSLVVPDGRPVQAPKPAAAAPSYAPSQPLPPTSGAWIWPVTGVITQYPSWYHMALDIAGPIGTPVVAVKSGRVHIVENLWYGYGHYVTVDHGGGMFSLYGHMVRSIVSPGQYVSQGQVIGYRGSTGRSTGPHVHFEIRVGGDGFGNTTNPLRYLR